MKCAMRLHGPAHHSHGICCLPLVPTTLQYSASALATFFQSQLHVFCRQIRKCVQQYESLGYPLHVLLNNAGLQVSLLPSP